MTSLNDDRFAIAQGPRARGAVRKLHALEKIQELLLETSLGFDLQVTITPIHELNIDKVGLRDV